MTEKRVGAGGRKSNGRRSSSSSLATRAWAVAGFVSGRSIRSSRLLLLGFHRSPAVVAHARGAARTSDPQRPRLNEALVFLPIGLVWPFRRFKTIHLQAPCRRAADRSVRRPGELLPGALAARGAPAGHEFAARKSTTPWSAASSSARGWRASASHRRPQADPARATVQIRNAWVLHAAGLAVVLPVVAYGFRHPALALHAGPGLARPGDHLDPHLCRAPMVGASGGPHHHRRALAAVVPVPQQQSAFRPPQEPDRRLVPAAANCSAIAATNGWR